MQTHFRSTFRFASPLSLIIALFCFVPIQKIHAQVNDSFPNILLIIADDLGVDVMPGYYQNPLMASTPTLDSLRSVGLTFDHAWAAPVCTPTRAAIMSGKHGIKTGVTGVPGNLDTANLSVFRALENQTNSRYSDAVIGKWHISQPSDPFHPQNHGVDRYMGFLNGFPADYNLWDRTENGMTSVDTSYVTSTITDGAIDWVSQQQKPWFLWLAHAASHDPFHEPPAHMHTISPTGSDYRKYLAMIESIDFEVNRLLRSMSDSVRDNTLVIFVGDNGTPGSVMQNYPAGHGKATVYQGGVRVPMIIAGAGVTRKGEREAALVNVVDLYATILEVTGKTLPGGVDNSLSFKHLFDNTPGETRDYNYAEITGRNREDWTIRSEQYKLLDFSNGRQEMYDLLADSLETNDLLLGTLTSAQQAVKADLQAEAVQRRTSWSCRDHIQNGDETGIDCGGSQCAPCAPNSIQDEVTDNEIFVYPNPAQFNLYITSQRDRMNEVTVYDIRGVLVKRYEDIQSQAITLDISSLSPQLYVVQIKTQAGIINRKFVKR